MGYDLSGLARSLAYGVPHRLIQVAQWEVGFWGPDFGGPVNSRLGELDAALRNALLPSGGTGSPPPTPGGQGGPSGPLTTYFPPVGTACGSGYTRMVHLFPEPTVGTFEIEACVAPQDVQAYLALGWLVG